MVTRAEVAMLADDLMKRKLRFRPYGRNPDYGMDCVGTVIWIGRELDLIGDRKIPCYSFPPSTENFEHLTEFLDVTDRIQTGTIIVFKTADQTPGHVGIATFERNGVWILSGSIPGTLEFGQFPLIPSISENVWRMFDYRNVE
jgi:hypothetical protein